MSLLKPEEIKELWDEAHDDTSPQMLYETFAKAIESAVAAKQTDASRFRRLCELHDGDDTKWHVRGADGQPIASGGLTKALDEMTKLAEAAG